MSTNPGWCPDPGGQPGQRYHDGHRWTQHFTPNPPAVQAPTAVAIAVLHGWGNKPRNRLDDRIETLAGAGAAQLTQEAKLVIGSRFSRSTASSAAVRIS